MKKPILIGISGGTASGKTTVTNTIVEHFDPKHVIVIRHDDYYKDQSKLTFEERLQTNYDHPYSLDNDLLIEHLKMLLNCQSINKPTYDFTKHTRSDVTEIVNPTDIIIVEGILVLEEPKLRDLMNIKLYVDTDDDIRFIRRLQRDITERERTIESVVKQYIETVKPMHNQFIEPSKRYADIIIPEGGNNMVAIDLIITKILSIISQENLESK